MSSITTCFVLFITFCTSVLYSNNAVSQDSRVIEVTINPYKTVSNGAFFKVMTLSSPDCYVEYLDSFEFEWGHQYQVKLKETELANPPMDGSSLEYELLEVLSDSIVAKDYSFSMWLSRDLRLGPGDTQEINFTMINDSTFLYMDQVKLVFGSSNKEVINQILEENKEIKAQFTILDDHTIRLK